MRCLVARLCCVAWGLCLIVLLAEQGVPVQAQPRPVPLPLQAPAAEKKPTQPAQPAEENVKPERAKEQPGAAQKAEEQKAEAKKVAEKKAGEQNAQEKQEGQQPADPKKDPAAQPLQNIIQNILGMGRGRQQAAAAENESQEETARKRDAVDQRVPLIREQEALLKNAQARIQRQQFGEALDILQTILDEEVESVVLGEDGNFHSIRWETQRILASLPADSRQLYEKTYGPLARRLLDQAAQNSDLEAIRRLAERYFHTQAGYAAANLVAAQHLDQGEFAIATRWYRRLENSNAEFVNDPLWRFKVGETYRQADFTESDLEPWVQMTDAQKQELSRRLQGGNPEDVRLQWQQFTNLAQRPLLDWLYPGGTRNRAGHAQGTPPLLISHWGHELVDHAEIQAQVTQLLDDLQINRTPAIPIMQPIVIGDRVAFRTFEGIRVVSAETGELLWETREAISPATLLRGTDLGKGMDANMRFQGRVNVVINGNVVSPYYGNQAEQHPVANLLFRDGVHGTISSDGERLFVIENNAVLANTPPGNYYANFNPMQNDPYRRDWSSNRLTAYDLETGQQLWHVGGRMMFEPIDPPLAGTFFFGPPLSDRGELFLIGEQENTLRLFCLNAATGEVNWSQLLAYTDVPIDRDVARRWWPAQVALSEGVLICPTQIGFLVGVDRRSQEILWITRYSDRNADKQQQQQQLLRGGAVLTSNPGTLRERWFSTPPMVIGQTVVHAPPEEAMLIGYRLTDGRERWRITDLKQGLYPLGQYQGNLIIVTETGLTGYSVETGKAIWEVAYTDFDPEFASSGILPCGRGVIMGSQLLLPINDQELWYFDLEQRKFVSRARVSREDLKLGNLVMARGHLVVASPLSVNLFQPKKDVEDEIERRLQQDSGDPWGLMKQAQVLTLEQAHTEALAALRQVNQMQLGEVQRLEFQRQLMETLIGIVRHEPLEFDAEFEELEQLVETPADRQLYLRLLAKRMLARKDLAAAFNAYAELARFEGEEQVRDLTDASLTVRHDVWLQARLLELWQISSGEVSSKISDSVRQAVQQALESNDLQQMLQVVRIYGFHPEIENIYLEMVDRATEERHFAAAEYALNSMARQEDRSIRASAIARRAELLVAFELSDDAAYCAEQLANFDADLVLLDGLTVQEWRDEFAAAQTDRPAVDSATLSWSGQEYEVIPIGTSNGSHQSGSVNLTDSPLPYYQQHRFAFDQRTSRLEVYDRRNDHLVWSIPLQQVDQVSAAQVLPIRCDGHVLTTYFRGVVQCYSLPDQRLLWSRAISAQPGVANQFQAGNARLPRLQEARYAAARFRLNQFTNEFGPLAITTSHTICYFGRNELIAVDPLDGEIRWVRKGVPRGTCVYGDEEVLCLVPPISGQGALLLNTADGTQLETKELDSLINRGIAVFGRNIITTQSGSGTRVLGVQGENVIISAENMHTRERLWEFPVSADDSLCQLDPRTLVIVGKEGAVVLLDLEQGEARLTSQLDPKIIRGQKELYAFAERDQLFLIANHGTNHSTYMNIYNQRVNGYLAALDRHTGEELWVHKTPSLNLVLSDLTQMPVFVLGGSKHERKHNLYVGRFQVQVLDKRTGDVLLEDTFTTQNQVQQITWSAARKQLRLHAYNFIFSIQPIKSLATAPAADVTQSEATP